MGNNDSKPEPMGSPNNADSSFEHVSDSDEYSTGDEEIQQESPKSNTKTKITTDNSKIAQPTPKKYSPFTEKFQNFLEVVNERSKTSQNPFEFENLNFDFKVFTKIQHEKMEECFDVLLENLNDNFQNLQIYRNIFYVIYKTTRLSWPHSSKSFEIAFNKIYQHELLKMEDKTNWNDVVMFGALMCELLGVYQADYYFITRQMNRWIIELINVALDGDDNGLIAFMLILNRLAKSSNPIKLNYKALWDVLKVLVGEDSQESKTTSITEILRRKFTATLEDSDEVKYQEEVAESDMCHRFEKFLESLDERRFARFDLNHFSEMSKNEIDFMTRKFIEQAIDKPQKIKFLAFIGFEYQNLLQIIRRFINKVVQEIEAEIDEIKSGKRDCKDLWYFENLAELIGELYVSEKKIISPVMLTHWLTVVLKSCGSSSFNLAAITMTLCGFLYKVDDPRNFEKVLNELKKAAVTDEKMQIVAEIEELDDQVDDELDKIYASRLFKAEPDAEMIFEIKSFLYHLQMGQRANFNYHTLYEFDNHDCYETSKYIIKKISQVGGNVEGVVQMAKFLKTLFGFSFKIGYFVKKLKANFEARIARMSPENCKEMECLGRFIGELRNLMVIDKVPQDEWLAKIKSFEPLKNHEVLKVELEVFRVMMVDLHQHDENKYLRYCRYVFDLRDALESANSKQDDENGQATSNVERGNGLEFSPELKTAIDNVCRALLASDINTFTKNILYRIRNNWKNNDWTGLIPLDDRKENDMLDFVQILFHNAISNRFVIKNYTIAIGKLFKSWSEDERGREFKKSLINKIQENFEAQLKADNPNEDDLKAIAMMVALLLKEKILTERIIITVLNQLKAKHDQDLFRRCLEVYLDTLNYDVGLIRRNSQAMFGQELRNAVNGVQMELKERSGFNVQQPTTSKYMTGNENDQLTAGPSGINNQRSQNSNRNIQGAKRSNQNNQGASSSRRNQQTVPNSWRSNAPLVNSATPGRSSSVPNQQRQMNIGLNERNQFKANSTGRTQSVTNAIDINQSNTSGINQMPSKNLQMASGTTQGLKKMPIVIIDGKITGRTQSVTNAIGINQSNSSGINQMPSKNLQMASGTTQGLKKMPIVIIDGKIDSSSSKTDQATFGPSKSNQIVTNTSYLHQVVAGSNQVAQITPKAAPASNSREVISPIQSPESSRNQQEITATQQYTEWQAKFAKEFIQTGQFDSTEIISFMIPHMTKSLETLKGQLNSLYNCTIVKPTLKPSFVELMKFLSEEVIKNHGQVMSKLVSELKSDCDALRRKNDEPKRIEFLRTMRSTGPFLDKTSFYSILEDLTGFMENGNLLAIELFLEIVENTKNVFADDCQERNYYIPEFTRVLTKAANFKTGNEMQQRTWKIIELLGSQNWHHEKFGYEQVQVNQGPEDSTSSDQIRNSPIQTDKNQDISKSDGSQNNSRQNSQESTSSKGSSALEGNATTRKSSSELVSEIKADCDALRRKDDEPRRIEFLKKIRTTAPTLDKTTFYTILEELIFYVKNGDIRAIRIFLDIVENTKDVLAVDCQERNYYVPSFIGDLSRAANYRSGVETQQRTLKAVEFLNSLNWHHEKFGFDRVQANKNPAKPISVDQVRNALNQVAKKQSIQKQGKNQNDSRHNSQESMTSKGNTARKGNDKRRAWYAQHMWRLNQQGGQRQSSSDNISISSSCGSQGSRGSRRSRRRNRAQHNRDQVLPRSGQNNQIAAKPGEINPIQQNNQNNNFPTKPVHNNNVSAKSSQNNQVPTKSAQINQLLATPAQINKVTAKPAQNNQVPVKPVQSNQLSAKENTIMDAQDNFKPIKKIEFYINQLDESNVLQVGKKIAPLLQNEQLERETLEILLTKGISDAKFATPVIGLFQFIFNNRGLKDKRLKMSNLIYHAFMLLCENDKDMVFCKMNLVKFTKDFDPFMLDSFVFILWRELLKHVKLDNPHALHALVLLMEDKLNIFYGQNQRANFLDDFLNTLKVKSKNQVRKVESQVDSEIKQKILKIIEVLESGELNDKKVKSDKKQARKTQMYDDKSSLAGSQSSIDSKGNGMSNRKSNDIKSSGESSKSLESSKVDITSAQTLDKISQPGTSKQIHTNPKQTDSKPTQIVADSNNIDTKSAQVDIKSSPKVQSSSKPKEKTIIDNRISLPTEVNQIPPIKASEVDQNRSSKQSNVIQVGDLEQQLKYISLQQNDKFEQNPTIDLDQIVSSAPLEPMNEEDRIRVINFTANHFLVDDSKSSTEKFEEILTSMIKQCVANSNDNLKVKESIAEAIVLVQCFIILENSIEIKDLAECFMNNYADIAVENQANRFLLSFLKAVKFLEESLNENVQGQAEKQKIKCDRFTKSVLRIKNAIKIEVTGVKTSKLGQIASKSSASSKQSEITSKSSKLSNLPVKYAALTTKSAQNQPKTLFVQKFIEQLQILILDVFSGRVFLQGVLDKFRRCELVCDFYLQNIFTADFIMKCLESLLENDDEQRIDSPGCLTLIIKKVGAMLEIQENEKLNGIFKSISNRKDGFYDFGPELLELRENRWSTVENFTPTFLNFHENPAKFFTFIETLWKKLMECPDSVLDLADTVEELWLHLDENFTILMTQFIENRRISFEKIPAEKFTNMVRQRLKASILFAFELSELEILDSENLAAWMTAENLEKLKDKEKIEIQRKIIEKI